ncbi:MAG TPA: hypothetical protein VFZ53_11925 [Polyangiaceae bacterium]
MKTQIALLLSVIGATALTGCASAGLEEEGGESVGTIEQPGITPPGLPQCTPPLRLSCTTSGCICVLPPVQVTYDTSTVCTVGGVSMHCCPTGKAMVGVHLDQNKFKCATLNNASGAVTLDAGTVRNNMHVCPFGSVMVGLHRDLNLLACKQVGSITTERVDTGTSDGTMHVCQNPVNTEAMSGIHADQNRFTCASNANFFRP